MIENDPIRLGLVLFLLFIVLFLLFILFYCLIMLTFDEYIGFFASYMRNRKEKRRDKEIVKLENKLSKLKKEKEIEFNKRHPYYYFFKNLSDITASWLEYNKNRRLEPIYEKEEKQVKFCDNCGAKLE